MKYVNEIILGDAFKLIKNIPDGVIDCMLTSSPFWLQRHYGTNPVVLGGDPDCQHEFQMKKGYKMNPDSRLTGRGFDSEYGLCACGAYYGEFGNEPTSNQFISNYLILLKEVVRVLKPTGTMFIEIQDKYGVSGYGKPTSKEFVPERLAIQLTNELDLYCRNDIILHKIPTRPESMRTRFSRKYTHLYFFTKKPSNQHYFDLESCKKIGVEGYLINPGDIWRIKSTKMKGSNSASFSTDLLETAIKAGCPQDGIVLDIFNGVGHTTFVAKQLGRKYCGFELLKESYDMSLELLNTIEDNNELK